MKIYWDIEQGSPEWYKIRAGIPTSSEFHRIFTPGPAEPLTKKGAPKKRQAGLTSGWRKYAYQLLVEKMLGESQTSIDHLYQIENGKLLEPQAARAYEFHYGVKTRRVGFITADDGRMGCSPDRLLIDAPGGVEIKCPTSAVQMAYWFDGFEEQYKAQTQGQMLIGELEFVDKFAYHPRLPPVPFRAVRDEPYIEKLKDALEQFCDAKDEMEARLRASGFFDQNPVVLDPWEDYLRRLDERAKILDAG